MSPVIADVAKCLSNHSIAVDGTQTGRFVRVVNVDDAAGLITVLVRFSSSLGNQLWQLQMRLDEADRTILADGGIDTIDAYGKTLAATVGEWRHTGLATVVVDAQQLLF